MTSEYWQRAYFTLTKGAGPDTGSHGVVELDD